MQTSDVDTRTTWKLDPAHSEIRFRVRHLLISWVTGQFNNYHAMAWGNLDEDGLENTKVDFTAQTASVDTNDAQRDNHLRSDDFFNAEQFPQIHFESTNIRKTGDGTYDMEGELIIRNITKPITLKVELGGITRDAYGQVKAGFDVTGKVHRREYGLKWNAITEAGAVVAGDEVKIECHVQFIKQMD